MKPFYLLLLFIMVMGCQQQVPETVYDLDAQSIIGQTRQMREATLYEAPQNRVTGLPIKIFKGHVSDIKMSTSEEFQNENILIVKIQKENKEALFLEMTEAAATQIVMDMDVIIHYQLKQEKVIVLEVERND